MKLEEIASPDIPALQDQCEGLLLLPLGATEQHGPHLPIGMDSLLADALIDAVSKESGVPYLQTLRITSSSAHTAKWPGTFSLSHETFIRVLVEVAEWAYKTGWTKLLLVNTHFGNDAPARVAVDKVRCEYENKFQVALINAFQITESVWETYTQDVEDLHANQAETSLMMHLFPTLVHSKRLVDADDPDRTEKLVFSYPVSLTSRNGVTGYPSRASKAEGSHLFKSMVSGLAAQVQSAKAERAPLQPLTSKGF